MKRFIPHLILILAAIFTIPVALKLFDIVNMPLLIAIIFHILSVITCAYGFYRLTIRPNERPECNVWWIFALVVCAVMPFYGYPFVIIMYIIHRIKGHHPPPIISDEITVPGPEVFGKLLTRVHQLEVLDRLDIEPFVDIFRRGQTELKKSAVKFLGSIRSQAALLTLNRALMDNDIEVRLFAAGVLGLIEDDYAKGIDVRKKQYETKPNDVKLAMALAELYLSYAESGLLDRIARDYYYHEIIALLSFMSESAESNFMLSKCYFALEEYDKAKEHTERCLAYDKTNSEYIELLCRILFFQGEYAALEQRMNEVHKAGISLPHVDVANFWK
ncbi:MAG: hypothetical protein ABH871_05585 [Pseudomonadota bacterium]